MLRATAVSENFLLRPLYSLRGGPQHQRVPFLTRLYIHVLCPFNLISLGGSWIGRGNRTETQAG